MKREAIFHTKTDRLMRRLKVPRWGAVGLLEMLWNFTARERPSGLLNDRSAEDVAIACGWVKDADVLLEALIETGWLDRNSSGISVHDWPDHCDNSVHLKLWKTRERFADGSVPKLPSNLLNSQEREEYKKWSAMAPPLFAMTDRGAATSPPVGPSLAKPSHSLPSQAEPVYVAAPRSEPPAAKPKQVLEMEPFQATDGDVIVERILGACLPRHPIPGSVELARSETFKKIRDAPDPAALADKIIAAHAKFCVYWETHPPDPKRLFAWWIRDGDYLHPPQVVPKPVSRPMSKQDQIAEVFKSLERKNNARQSAEP